MCELVGPFQSDSALGHRQDDCVGGTGETWVELHLLQRKRVQPCGGCDTGDKQTEKRQSNQHGLP